jgi:CubicO group peptidase (beta-lactamase class C family)
VPPESVGFSASALAAARAKLETTAATGLVAVIGGRIVFEYGDTDTVSAVASVRKSILSMLFGPYVQRGLIDLQSSLQKLGIDDVGGLSTAEKQATVRDLLTARSGIYHAAANEGDDRAEAPSRGSKAAGSFFLYNNWDFNALGTIFEQATNQTIYDALLRDLAQPLQMEDFIADGHRRGGDASRSAHLAYHMRLSVRDMARLGYLMLREGKWNGRQIIPGEWVRESTRAFTPRAEMNPPARRGDPWGYGYLWWVWDGPNTPSAFKDAYAAGGAFGQNIVVLPALDLVVASKTLGDENRNLSTGEFLSVLDLIVQAKTGRQERAEVEVPDSVLRTYVAEYELGPTASLTISLEDGQLFAQLTGQRRVPIFPESDTSFFYRDANAWISFTKDSSGVVTGLVLHQTSGRANTARRRSP